MLHAISLLSCAEKEFIQRALADAPSWLSPDMRQDLPFVMIDHETCMSACVQELSENMGLIKLNQRLQDPQLAEWFAGIFPRDTPKNMRFSINFFTSIGLGGLTDALREHLAALPKLLAEQRAAQAAAQQSASLPLNCTQFSVRWLLTANSLPKGLGRNVFYQ